MQITYNKNFRLMLTWASILALSILLSGCSTVNSLRMTRINADVTPIVGGESRVKLKSVYEGEKPYVYATVDGQELLFLVDSGASFLILMDTPKVRRLKLERGFDLALKGWGEEDKSAAYQTTVNKLELGDIYFEDLGAALIPVSQSQYFLRDDEAIFDGVIGHDLMRHFSWEFDANVNDIVISTEPYQPVPNAQYLEFDTFLSKISVKGSLAFNPSHSIEGEFLIDTGSRHYVKLSTAYVDNNELDIASARVRAADFGLSGMVEHERVTLPSLALGDIHLNNVKVNLIPGDDEDDWWVIGNALMNQFKTIIDYKSDAFYLVPQAPFKTDYNLSGLELRKVRSGEFVVRYVSPDLPASELDIHVGDLVTSINGISSQKMTLAKYNDIASVPGTQHICIERAARCFEIGAEPIIGYSDF
ncbi:aspartyl protease family protein [Aestuariibacter salexigens]|uniref:aspartyl protease family protein n=1 Tax=Aestuariibacter salexigens TaxID=226010 RepID=UPI00146FAA0C|nr:aspartyl protease family protein [Aestuariibacter salexigens]